MNVDTTASGLLPTANLLQEAPKDVDVHHKEAASMTPPAILVAQMEHLAAAKKLADKHKRELGFINRAILQKAIESQSLLIAPCHVDPGSELAGMVHFYVRLNNMVTLCNIVVANEYQRRGLGRRLFEELVRLTCSLGKTQIRLKCPTELPANLFYKQLGLKIVAVESGKHRPLNVWIYSTDNEL